MIILRFRIIRKKTFRIVGGSGMFRDPSAAAWVASSQRPSDGAELSC
jgi:hypothetical protein